MIAFVLGLPHALAFLALIPMLALSYLLSSSLLRIGVRLFFNAFRGCQRLSDAIVMATTSGTTRATRVTLGLGYLGVRKTLRPVHVRFERVEQWVELRLVPREEGSIADAVEYLGLKGQFTRADLDRQYKHVMQFAHPDKGGTVGMAKRANAARDMLMIEKGWR